MYSEVLQLSPQSILEHFHPPKEPQYPLASTPHFPPTPLSTLGYHPSLLCVYGFAYSEHFIYMESYNVCSFVASFFHLAYFRDSMLQHVSVLQFFLLLNNIPCIDITTFFHSLVNEHFWHFHFVAIISNVSMNVYEYALVLKY